MATPHTIYLSRNEDGTFLGVSIDAPRFCLHANTLDEVRAKVARALDYFENAKYNAITTRPKSTRVISPVFEPEEICA